MKHQNFYLTALLCGAFELTEGKASLEEFEEGIPQTSPSRPTYDKVYESMMSPFWEGYPQKTDHRRDLSSPLEREEEQGTFSLKVQVAEKKDSLLELEKQRIEKENSRLSLLVKTLEKQMQELQAEQEKRFKELIQQHERELEKERSLSLEKDRSLDVLSKENQKLGSHLKEHEEENLRLLQQAQELEKQLRELVLRHEGEKESSTKETLKQLETLEVQKLEFERAKKLISEKESALLLALKEKEEIQSKLNLVQKDLGSKESTILLLTKERDSKNLTISSLTHERDLARQDFEESRKATKKILDQLNHSLRSRVVIGIEPKYHL